MTDVTQLLCALDQGDPHAASRLLPLVYEEMRELAAPAQKTGQGRQLLRRRGQVSSGQAQRGVPGAMPAAAVGAIVVGLRSTHRSQRAQKRFSLPTLELGGLTAGGADAAGAVVPLLFKGRSPAHRKLKGQMDDIIT
jgi:hypothetical protein